MFCRNCGKELSQGVHFCSNCGFAIAEEKNPIQHSSINQANSSKIKKPGVGLIIFFFCLITLSGLGALAGSTEEDFGILAIPSGLGIIASIIYTIDLRKGKYDSFSGKAITVLSLINIILSIFLFLHYGILGLGMAFLPICFSIYNIQKVKQNSEYKTTT